MRTQWAKQPFVGAGLVDRVAEATTADGLGAVLEDERTQVLARVAHDVGLAAWFGGAWFGAAAMNAATREVDDHTQRIRLANAGWFRWAPVVALAMGSHLAGGFVLDRAAGTQPPGVLAGVRTGMTLAAVLATAETGRSGQQVVRGGDVPVATAVQPISDTPQAVANAQRRLRIVQWIVPSLTGALWVLDAVQSARRECRLLWRR